MGMSAAFKGPPAASASSCTAARWPTSTEVNRAGGVHGNKIVIKAYDDGYNPIPAIENTIRLIEQDEVFLLFDYMGTPDRHAHAAAAEAVRATSPSTCSSRSPGPSLSASYPYDEFVFNLRASYQQETAGLVDHFVGIGRKRIAVFYQIDAYGRSGWDGVRSAWPSTACEMVGEATYERGTPFTASFGPQVDILRKANPDAIISIGTYSACAGFIRDVRDAGWDVPIANVSGVDSENLLAAAPGARAGRPARTTRANLINSQVVPSYHDTACRPSRNTAS